jgi:excinuclease UvrABC ATPase subunit
MGRKIHGAEDLYTCEGARLKKESLWFKVDEKNIAELSNMNLDKLHAWFTGVEDRLSNKQNQIAKDILKRSVNGCNFYWMLD